MTTNEDQLNTALEHANKAEYDLDVAKTEIIRLRRFYSRDPLNKRVLKAENDLESLRAGIQKLCELVKAQT